MSMTNPIVGPSGPSIYSKRTDLPKKPEIDLGSTSYGEGQETAMLNTAAPKATTRGIADNVGGRPKSASVEPVTPLFAPTTKPSESITAGIDIGPDVGSSSLLMQSQFANNKVSTALAQMLPYDQTGEIAILYQQALARGM